MSDASKPFVETVRIQNFGCARDVMIELTRLHALIGPNDSGKSTVLGAVRTACELIKSGEQRLGESGYLDAHSAPGSIITMAWPVAGTRTKIDWFRTEQRYWKLRAEGTEIVGPSQIDLQYPVHYDFATPVRGAMLVRWDPDAIRRPCELIPDGRPLTVGERGEGLPAIYDAILSRDRQAFDQIEDGVRRHFPTVKNVWLPTSAKSTKALGAILNDGTRIHTNEMSEGLLYWLAFAALPHVDPTAFLLVEEPENGLHPSRIGEVVKILREVSRHMQVLIATHSPLVINELQADEVTILTRDPKAGTRATRMDRTKHFQQRQQVYALGELWLSFADGLDEAALVSDGTTHQPAG